MQNKQIQKQIKDAVKVIGSTLGPNGKLVAITTENPNTHKCETILTKDGYKVSQSLKRPKCRRKLCPPGMQKTSS